MANTYTQLLTHLVFAVRNRDNLIVESIRDRVEKFITGIIKKDDCKLLAIYCMPDHCHILIGLNPDKSISSLVRNLKSKVSKWINDNGILPGRFYWQEGCGAFSYSKSQLDSVVNYILNQPERHKKKTFREEYIEILKKFKIDYNKEYVFDFFD